jgi:hypothetical protein
VVDVAGRLQSRQKLAGRDAERRLNADQGWVATATRVLLIFWNRIECGIPD